MQGQTHNLSRKGDFMKSLIFFAAGHSQSLAYAAEVLQKEGFCFAPEPDRSVTHLLLDIPHKDWASVPDVLSALSNDVTVIGGNLRHPCLAEYKTVDLLSDPLYLAENANITAHCAIKLALQNLPVILENCPVLVIGWGRIGKCLAKLLRNLGALVTVAARKESDRAMLSALGYTAAETGFLADSLSGYRLIFNTVPAGVLPESVLSRCSEDCCKIELASLPGIAGSDVIDGKGLPGKLAPETSGSLIAQTILRLKGALL